MNGQPDDGQTWLMLFACFGDIDELMTCQEDVNAQDDNGRSALMWAAFAGKTDCVVELLKRGAGIEATNKCGETALDVAKSDEIRKILATEHEARKILAVMNSGLPTTRKIL